MRARIEEQREKRHTPSSMYTRLLGQAEQQVRSELSAALDSQEDNLDDFIAEQTAQATCLVAKKRRGKHIEDAPRNKNEKGPGRKLNCLPFLELDK